jgi:hypothetical protein
MRKKYFVLLLFLASIISNSQIITFPDANFKSKLLASGIDTNSDNEIDQSEALSVTSLNISYSNISSIAGIEYFTNLNFFRCNSNNLTTLPIQNLVNLSYLGCESNQITSLSSIENLTSLNDLYFDNNLVTSINVQNLLNLDKIWCSNNLLSTINLCGTSVFVLWCENNPNLQTLYLKNTTISVSRSNQASPPPLYSFDFDNNPSLNYICYDEGEYTAILNGLNNSTAGITFDTSCELDCQSLNLSSFENTKFNIFPNPTSEEITIQADEKTNFKSVSIYNTMGQLVKVGKPKVAKINVSDLKAGVYFISLEQEQSSLTKQFIKI